LELLLQECQLLLSKQVKVPKVRFGKTELQMPIVTLGCMRFQQEWGPRITKMNMVGSDCQDNLVAILRRAILEFGISHIETARGYGSSELQLGVALKQLYASGLVKREDLIIQTKIGANADAKEFRAQLENSLERLQMDYVDLFAFHGFAHFEAQMEWVFGKQPKDNSGGETEQGKETCLDVVREFIKAGKIRHLGFSSHGPPELIRRALESNVFDYVNLHNHYFGSYTNSGYGGTERGNADLMKLAHDKDLGSKCLYICCTVVNLVSSYAYWGLVCRCKSLSSVPTIKVASFTNLLENCVR
jgi:predicted aldo/keto reductase-like oxidoreductase